ncbi:2'-5' RNA ligase family protein [Algoriphagus sp. H41]|uniref:2'-5' RNA ligase family protein n=1 Tax=Algoriphagus oliviformis TaxID=2811231 RepID=A0ABS3BXJ7_9BACT|nr:2'-5' RNA ligase family protein [Algoriphagus oliviformis]MBN7809402.1 2'-5' RNA ligase family protein [Algoriphagus oliviformis]
MGNEKPKYLASERVYEYLLLTTPNETVGRFAWNLKRLFTKNYRCLQADMLSPHITVGTFLLRKKLESKIVDKLREFAMTVTPFTAEFDGFGSFPKKVVFLDIANKEPFHELSKGSRDSSSRFNNDNSHFSFNAHLTIARSMNAEQFENAWRDWKDKAFKASSDVNEMLLLRRPFHHEQRNRFEKVTTFVFRGKKGTGGQLKLDF